MLVSNEKRRAVIVLIAVVIISGFLIRTVASVEELLLAAILFVSFVLLLSMIISSENYAYYFLIPLIPFSQSVPVLSLGSRSINLGMDTIFISILILRNIFSRKKKSHLINKSDRSSLLLIGWLIWNFITVCVSSLYLTTNQVIENFIVLLRWGQYVPIFIILANGKLNYDQSKKALLILYFSGLAAAGLAFYQIYEGLNPLYFKGAPSFTVPLFRESDPGELLDSNGYYMGSANYNVAGSYLAIAILLSISYFSSSIKKHVKIFGLMSLLVMAGGIVVTSSRSSLIALIVSLMIYAHGYSRRLFVYSLGLTPLFITISLISFPDFPLIADLVETASNLFSVIPRVLDGQQWSSSSDVSSQVYGAASRVVGMRDSIYIFLYNPLFGYGYNAYQFFGLNNTPDNYFFQTLAETGLVGFVLMIMFFRELFRSVKYDHHLYIEKFSENYRIGMRSVVIAMLLVNFSSGIFYVQKVWGTFLVFAGIWYAIMQSRKFSR